MSSTEKQNNAVQSGNSTYRLVVGLLMACSIISIAKVYALPCVRPELRLNLAGTIFQRLFPFAALLVWAHRVSQALFVAAHANIDTALSRLSLFPILALVPAAIYTLALVIYLGTIMSIANLFLTAIHELISLFLATTKLDTMLSLNKITGNPENRPLTNWNFNASFESPPFLRKAACSREKLGENSLGRLGFIIELCLWLSSVNSSTWLFTSGLSRILVAATLKISTYLSPFLGSLGNYLVLAGAAASEGSTLLASLETFFNINGYANSLEESKNQAITKNFITFWHILAAPFFLIPDKLFRSAMSYAIEDFKNDEDFAGIENIGSRRVTLLRELGLTVHRTTFEMLCMHMSAGMDKSKTRYDPILSYTTLTDSALLEAVGKYPLYRQMVYTAIFNALRARPDLIVSPQSTWFFTIYLEGYLSNTAAIPVIDTEFIKLRDRLYGENGFLTYTFARANDMSEYGFETSVLEEELNAGATGVIDPSVQRSMVYSLMLTSAPHSGAFLETPGEYTLLKFLADISQDFSDPDCLNPNTSENLCPPQSTGQVAYIIPPEQAVSAIYDRDGILRVILTQSNQ